MYNQKQIHLNHSTIGVKTQGLKSLGKNNERSVHMMYLEKYTCCTIQKQKDISKNKVFNTSPSENFAI